MNCLICLLCQIIGMSSRHYYPYCNFNDNKWYEFDDSISEIDEERVVTDNAYCLF